MNGRERKSSYTKASLRLGVAIVATAWFALPESQSFATPITTPTDLLPGAQYRLAFLTAGTRDAASSLVLSLSTSFSFQEVILCEIEIPRETCDYVRAYIGPDVHPRR